MSQPTPSTILTTQLLSISTSLLISGAILSLSAFTTPILQALPPTHSLPQLASLFSSGSHIFPQLATVSSAGFANLAYHSPASSNAQTLNAIAAAGVISIAPWTFLVMKGTNMTLRGIEEEYQREGEGAIGKEGGEERVRSLMGTFKWMNYVRAAIMATGGVVGLWAAMAA